MTTDHYTALIVDDESNLRESLRMKLATLCPQIEIIGEAGDARSGKTAIEQFKPDLVFLDINMPLGSGFDLLSELNYIDFEVIFVTGYDQYALKALRLSAVDYLLKPVVDEELLAATVKAKERLRNKTNLAELHVLKHNLDHASSQRSKLSIPGLNSMELVDIGDVIRCEGEQRYTRVWMKTQKSVLSSYNIGVFKELLADFQFFSSHKSHLINLLHIKRYVKEGVVIMSDDSEVPVSRRKKEEFKSIINQMIADGRQISS